MLSVVTTYVVLRIYFRRELRQGMECAEEEKRLEHGGRLVLAGLVFMVAVLLTASALNIDLGLPTCVAALLITAIVSWQQKTNPLRLVKQISWATLLLVAGLFIMVHAIEGLGVLRYTQAALAWARHLPVVVCALVISFVVGVANNLVNNLPLGLIAGATVQAAHMKGLVANAVLVGVDLGPNLSVTGSLATILWLLALRREKLNVSGFDFLKAGLLAMPAAMLAAVAGLLLIHVLTRQ